MKKYRSTTAVTAFCCRKLAPAMAGATTGCHAEVATKNGAIVLSPFPSQRPTARSTRETDAIETSAFGSYSIAMISIFYDLAVKSNSRS